MAFPNGTHIVSLTQKIHIFSRTHFSHPFEALKIRSRAIETHLQRTKPPFAHRHDLQHKVLALCHRIESAHTRESHGAFHVWFRQIKLMRDIPWVADDLSIDQFHAALEFHQAAVRIGNKVHAFSDLQTVSQINDPRIHRPPRLMMRMHHQRIFQAKLSAGAHPRNPLPWSALRDDDNIRLE